MSEHPTTPLTLSTLNLSVDGTHAAPDQARTNVPVTAAAALTVLRAFARLTAMDLVDVEAKIYLAGPRGKVAVQNVGGRLFVSFVPESINAAVERTPEDILAMLTTEVPVEAAAPEAVAADDVARPAGGLRALRRRLTSGWTVAALAVAAFGVGLVGFAPETPEGVEIIRDPARITSLHAQFDGRYGVPASTVLSLDHGRLTGRESAATGGADAPLFEKSYQFGLREGQVVLVVDNGALLEPQPDGSLKFLDSMYPRQPR